MTSTSSELDGTRPRPSAGGSLVYLAANLPLGVASFTVLVTLAVVGIGTVLFWVGVPVLVLMVLLVRGAANAERVRVHVQLRTYVAKPYLPLPDGGWLVRWKARIVEGATWRDFGYFLLLLPLGIAEFVLVVTSWSLALGLTGLPIYVHLLPDDAVIFLSGSTRWVAGDSTLSSLPWAALGVLCLGVAVALTRALGALHARIARSLLGPGPLARRRAEADDSGAHPFVTAA
jgi:hypothetical protein